MPARPAICRAVAAIALLLASVAAFAGVASAHASLVSSDPANDVVVARAPKEVALTFDEKVVPAGDDAITVLGPRGQGLEQGAPRTSDGGRTISQAIGGGGVGTHTVSYRLVSDDGHVVTGSFVFHVERATSRGGATADADRGVQVLGVVGRTLAYAGSLLAIGALVVAVWVDGGGTDRDGGPERGGSGSGAHAARAGDRRWPDRRLWIGAALTALAGSVLSLLAFGAELAGGSVAAGPAAVGEVVRVSGWVTGPAARVLVATLFLAATLLPRRLGWAPWLAAGSSSVLLVLPALSGHASATSAAAMAVDAAHLLGAAVWVGGLAAVVLTWRPDRDRLQRFSRLAAWSVLVVLASGAAGAWWQLGGPGELTTSAYGRTLLVKVAFVAAVLFFGWVNRRWLADATLSVVTMVRSLRVEVALAVCVLAAAAVLVDTRQPAERAAEPVQVVGQAGDTTVRLQVVPAEAGPNEAHLYFLAVDGSLRPVEAAELRVSAPRVQARRVPLAMITPSHATATGIELTPGRWNFRVSVVVSGQPMSTTLEVPIR